LRKRKETKERSGKQCCGSESKSEKNEFGSTTLVESHEDDEEMRGRKIK
jgi:hypothetical protein